MLKGNLIKKGLVLSARTHRKVGPKCAKTCLKCQRLTQQPQRVWRDTDLHCSEEPSTTATKICTCYFSELLFTQNCTFICLVVTEAWGEIFEICLIWIIIPTRKKVDLCRLGMCRVLEEACYTSRRLQC